MSILNPNNSNLPNQYVENPNPENLSRKGVDFAKKILNPADPSAVSDQMAESWVNPKQNSDTTLRDSDGDGTADDFLGTYWSRVEEDTGQFGQDPSTHQQTAKDKIDEATNKIRHNIDVGDIFSGAVDNSVGAGPGMGYVADQFDNEFNPFNGENEDNDNGGLLNIPGVSVPGVSLPEVETPNFSFNPFEGLDDAIIKILAVAFAGLITLQLVENRGRS